MDGLCPSYAARSELRDELLIARGWTQLDDEFGGRVRCAFDLV